LGGLSILSNPNTLGEYKRVGLREIQDEGEQFFNSLDSESWEDENKDPLQFSPKRENKAANVGSYIILAVGNFILAFR